MRFVLLIVWVGAVASTLLAMRYVDGARESHAPKVATLDEALGVVQVRPADSLLWNDCVQHQELKEGDSLFVGAKGRATIRFVDGRTVNLGADSQVSLSSESQDGDVVSGFTLRVITGEVVANAIKESPRRAAAKQAPVLKIVADRREIALPKSADAVRVSLPDADEALTLAPLAGVPQLKDLEAKVVAPRPLARPVNLPKKPEVRQPPVLAALAGGVARVPTSTSLAAVDFRPAARAPSGEARPAAPQFDLEGKATRLPLSGSALPEAGEPAPLVDEGDLLERNRPEREYRKLAVATPDKPPRLATALPQSAFFTLRPFNLSAAFPALSVPLKVTGGGRRRARNWRAVLALRDDAGHSFHANGSNLTADGGSADIPVGRLARLGFAAKKGQFAELRLELQPFAVPRNANDRRPEHTALGADAQALTLRFLGGQGAAPLRVDLGRLERQPLAGDWSPDPGPAQTARFSIYLAHGHDLKDLGAWLAGSQGFSGVAARIDDRTTWHFVKDGQIVASLVGATSVAKIRQLRKDLESDLVFSGTKSQLVQRRGSAEEQAQAVGGLLKTKEVIYAQFRDEVRPINAKFAAEHPEVIQYILKENFAVFDSPVKSLGKDGGDAANP